MRTVSSMGASLSFEPIDPRHEAAIQTLVSDPLIAEMTTIPHPYPADGASRWIRSVIERRAAGVEYAFAMVDAGELVGVVTLTEIGREPDTGEWGSWVCPAHWRRGYAARGGHWIARFAFGELGLKRIVAFVRGKNHRSLSLPFKLGFRMTQTIRGDDGKDVFHYELLARDYPLVAEER